MPCKRQEFEVELKKHDPWVTNTKKAHNKCPTQTLTSNFNSNGKHNIWAIIYMKYDDIKHSTWCGGNLRKKNSFVLTAVCGFSWFHFIQFLLRWAPCDKKWHDNKYFNWSEIKSKKWIWSCIVFTCKRNEYFQYMASLGEFISWAIEVAGFCFFFRFSLSLCRLKVNFSWSQVTTKQL